MEGSGPRSNTDVRQYEIALRPFKAERMKRLISTVDDFLVEADDPKGSENYTVTIVVSRSDAPTWT